MFYQLSASTAASMESVLAPTNASVSQDTLARLVIRVGFFLGFLGFGLNCLVILGSGYTG